MRLDEALRSRKRFGHLGSGWHEPPVRDGDKRYWTAADVLATDWEVEREPREWVVCVDVLRKENMADGHKACKIRVREVMNES